MNKYALVFPGQGAQKVGMMDAFLSESLIQEHLVQAQQVLDFDIVQLMAEGPVETLTQTYYAQLALFVMETGLYRLWRNRIERSPVAVAGHSLGEYSALYAAEVISLEQGLELVKHRAAWMQEDCEAAAGAMSAIIRPDLTQIKNLCQDYARVVVANDNSPDQVVLSGDAEQLQMLNTRIKNAKAGRPIALKVSGAFHSPLMQSASINMEKLLRETPFSPAAFPVVMNSVARGITDPEDIKAALQQQMLSPVRWRESMQALPQIDTVVELGPPTLKRLVQQNISAASFVSPTTPEEMLNLTLKTG